MSGHGTCACGKDNTAESHGLQRDDAGEVLHRALSCDEVIETRERVARDLTREAMNPWQRLTTWATGRSGEYSDAAYQAAWATPRGAGAEVRAR